jgi:ribosomal protein L17
MRHQKTRHKLSRDASHRKALLANLCVEVIDHERIKTTEAKAKAVKPEIEKLITLARKGDPPAPGQGRHLQAVRGDRATLLGASGRLYADPQARRASR